MDITVEDLQALTLLAQDPQARNLVEFKAQLSSEAARQLADAIVKLNSGQKDISSDPIGRTAQAISDWVIRNRAVARPQARSELRDRKKAAQQNWMTEHAAAWQA